MQSIPIGSCRTVRESYVEHWPVTVGDCRQTGPTQQILQTRSQMLAPMMESSVKGPAVLREVVKSSLGRGEAERITIQRSGVHHFPGSYQVHVLMLSGQDTQRSACADGFGICG